MKNDLLKINLQLFAEEEIEEIDDIDLEDEILTKIKLKKGTKKR